MPPSFPTTLRERGLGPALRPSLRPDRYPSRPAIPPSIWSSPDAYAPRQVPLVGPQNHPPLRTPSPPRTPLPRRTPNLPSRLLSHLSYLLVIGETIDDVWPAEKVSVDVGGGPWYIARDCNIPRIDCYWDFAGQTAVGGGLCIGGQGGPNPGMPDFYELWWRSRATVILGKTNKFFPTDDRGTHGIYVSRAPGMANRGCYHWTEYQPGPHPCNPVVRPGRDAHVLPLEDPYWPYWPALDPFMVPVTAPQPLPFPLPYRLLPYREPNLWRTHQEQRQAGYRVPAPRADGELVLGVGTTVGNPMDIPPETQVQVDVVTGPKPQVDVSSTTSPPNPTRPGERVKERKVRIPRSAAGVILHSLINLATEGLDLVNELHKALPPSRRFRRNQDGSWRRATQWERMQDLYQHYDEIDIGQAIANVVANEVEDRAYARIGQAAQQSLRKNPFYHRPVGWQSGQWDTISSVL